MAITVTNKGTLFSTSNASVYTVTITAPTTNRVQLAFVLNSKATNPDIPTSVTSTGLTWTRLSTLAFAPISGGLRRLSVYCAAGTSSDTTVDITFPSNQTGCAAMFSELDGVDTTGIGGVNAFADMALYSQDGATTFAGLDLGGIVFAGDAVICAVGLDQNPTSGFTPSESFIETTTDGGYSTPSARLMVMYNLTYDTTPTATWSPNTSSGLGAIALELKLLANAFKSNPKPGELVTLSEGAPIINLIMGPLVIPLRSDTVTVSDTPTVQIWQTEWLGTVDLIDEPQVADLVTVSDGLPNVTVSGLPQPNVADSVTLTDTLLVRGLVVVIPVADLLAIGDNPPTLALSGGGVWSINVSDPLTLTDTPNPNLIEAPQVNDLLTLGENRTVQVLNQPQAADTTTLSETLALQLIVEPQAAETLTLADTVTVKGLILLIPANELAVTVSDFRQVVTVGVIPVDNYDDNTTNTGLWDVLATSTATDALVLVSETGHQLRITPRSNAGAVDAYNGYRSVSSFNFTDQAAFVEVVQVAGVGTTANTILALAIDTNNEFRIAQEQGLLYFQDRVAGITNGPTVAYNATTHRWWRIRHVSAGDTIRFDTSPNGTVWTEQRNIPRPSSVAATALSIGLEAGTYADVGAPGVAIFDNLNSTTLTAFPVDAITLTDTRTVQGLILKPIVAEIVTLDEFRIVGGTRVIDVVDSMTLGDSAEAELVSPMSDTVTITDSAQAGLWLVSWYGATNLLDMPHSADSLTLTDNRTVTVSATPTLIISVADVITLTDQVAVNLLNQPLVPDTVTMTDGVTVNALVSPHLLDTLTLTDTLTINLVYEPQPAADLLTSTDVVTVKGLIPAMAAVDSITLTDVATITGLILPIPAADLITLSENRTVIAALPGIWQIPAGDSVALTDTTTVIGLILQPIIADSVTLTEQRTVELIYEPHAADVLTLTEAVTVKGLTTPVSAGDVITTSDVASGQLSKLLIARGDQVTLTESRSLTLVDQFITVPLIGFSVPGRDMTVTATVGISTFTVPARDMTVDPTPVALVFTAPSRDMTVTGVVGISTFTVPARDMSVAA